MRIAYVSADPGVPVFGRKGCSIHVQEVITAMRAQDHCVELFASSIGGDPLPGLDHLPIHRLPVLPKGDPAAREQAALRVNSDLRSLLERAGPFDMIYERYSLWSFAAMEFARTAGIPGLLEVNAPLVEEQAEYRCLVDRVSAERVAETVFAAATALIAVSKDIAAYLYRYPDTRGRVHIIPNGVNPIRFPHVVAPSCPAAPGTFTVGFLGSLKRWHGLSVLVEAFAMLHHREPNSRLLIVGDGPERQSLMDHVSRVGLLHSVHFTGSVAPWEVPGLLASIDVAVAPYHELPSFYFSPLKVYEYMAAGLPVVACRIGQICEIIEDEVNGILYPPDDFLALVIALDRLRRDPQMRTRLGQAARAKVLREHTWDSVVKRIMRVADTAATSPRLEV